MQRGRFPVHWGSSGSLLHNLRALTTILTLQKNVYRSSLGPLRSSLQILRASHSVQIESSTFISLSLALCRFAALQTKA